MVACCYYKCTNSTHKNKVRMFRFVRKLSREKLQEWINNCGNPKLFGKSSSFLNRKTICEAHFRKEDILPSGRLMRNAVPVSYKSSNGKESDVETTQPVATSPCPVITSSVPPKTYPGSKRSKPCSFFTLCELKENMIKATEEVVAGSMDCCRASVLFNVPDGNLQNIVRNVKKGQSPEEACIKEFCGPVNDYSHTSISDTSKQFGGEEFCGEGSKTMIDNKKQIDNNVINTNACSEAAQKVRSDMTRLSQQIGLFLSGRRKKCNVNYSFLQWSRKAKRCRRKNKLSVSAKQYRDKLVRSIMSEPQSQNRCSVTSADDVSHIKERVIVYPEMENFHPDASKKQEHSNGYFGSNICHVEFGACYGLYGLQAVEDKDILPIAEKNYLNTDTKDVKRNIESQKTAVDDVYTLLKGPNAQEIPVKHFSSLHLPTGVLMSAKQHRRVARKLLNNNNNNSTGDDSFLKSLKKSLRSIPQGRVAGTKGKIMELVTNIASRDLDPSLVIIAFSCK